ncbi:hypothetical protein AMELA_G00231330, partial [Ameiurus melas]
MEEMLLRVCVVVVSLLYIKDHTVFQEQEEIIIMDMQEREYLLQKEAAKLEQEVHQVTTGLPHLNQEVLQSHQRMTNGEGEDSDVQQDLANVKVENPHEHQMPHREEQDILHQNLLIKDIQDEAVPHTHDSVPSVLHDGVIVDDNFTSEKGIQPEIVRVSQNEIKNFQEDDMLEHKKEVPHNDQKMKTLNEDQIKDVQGKSPLKGLHDSDKKSSHLDQMGESNHMPSEEISEEDPTASRQQSTENPYVWYLWKFLSLIS